MLANNIFRVSNIYKRLYTLSTKQPVASTIDLYSNVFFTQSRNTSFFNKLPAEFLWKGCTSVSNAGKKRGRGKTVNKKNIKNLNRGQIIGVGKGNMIWPGLSAPIIRGRELVQQQKLPEDPDRDNKLAKLRDEHQSFRSIKLSPIERGWSGARLPGRSVGPPDAVGEDAFENFDTKVLEMKQVFHMSGTLGRKRCQSIFVVTGNGQGLAGFGLGKAADTRAALRRAKNRAGQKLMYFELYKNHTIFHDFFTCFGKTKIFVTKKAEGHGLVCHRAIKSICEVIGIKDLHAKVEGSTNLQNIVKAFFLGLLQQKSHQVIAEEKRLHLVEFSKGNNEFPVVVASPKNPRSAEEISRDEVIDYNRYIMNDKVVLKKKKYPPFYASMPSHTLYLKKCEKRRNHDLVRLNMLVEHGELKSFMTDKYPECRPGYAKKEE
ncbi:28S ribosomal protein S5, mitochondrial-like [Ctenocephalides felis]|uniref:28S ribosomal protein S5, mitochondrial-like n=1 Tax=Ctenocephalides felis TaxID=7515 RepID=UPI000E6E5A46|nr:28S ribosomal protein S5, mitochondrial-like [Ctenocephalides felis]